MNPKTKRPKAKTKPRARREPRIRAIVEAAEQVFLSQGYEAASLDEVARIANASKATIYAHFENKMGLFRAAIADKLAQVSEPLRQAEATHVALAKVLTLFARNFLTLLLSPGAIKIYRLMVSQGTQFPELAQMWFANGPSTAMASLAAFLRERTARGELDIADPDQAAEFFLMMLRGRLHLMAVTGLSQPPYTKEIAQKVDGAVAMFTRAYAIPAKSKRR
jgi:TetR/AcrR family transcriptional repressor of mexJK operon